MVLSLHQAFVFPHIHLKDIFIICEKKSHDTLCCVIVNHLKILPQWCREEPREKQKILEWHHWRTISRSLVQLMPPLQSRWYVTSRSEHRTRTRFPAHIPKSFCQHSIYSAAETSCIVLLLILQNPILPDMHAPKACLPLRTTLSNMLKHAHGLRSSPPFPLPLHTCTLSASLIQHEDLPLGLLCLLIIVSRVSTMQS